MPFVCKAYTSWRFILHRRKLDLKNKGCRYRSYIRIRKRERNLKIYTSTKKIPGLEKKGLTERLALLEEAGKRLSVPQKTVLNVLKLLVLIPTFVLILRTSESFMSLAWALIILLLYPLFVKPIQYSLSARYLDEVIAQAKKTEEDL